MRIINKQSFIKVCWINFLNNRYLYACVLQKGFFRVNLSFWKIGLESLQRKSMTLFQMRLISKYHERFKWRKWVKIIDLKPYFSKLWRGSPSGQPRTLFVVVPGIDCWILVRFLRLKIRPFIERESFSRIFCYTWRLHTYIFFANFSNKLFLLKILCLIQ